MSSAARQAIELYVYYKVAETQAAAALQTYEQAQAGLGGPHPRLLRRTEVGAGLQTWMEIHRSADPEADERCLSAAMAPFILGDRHVERFVPLL